MLIRKPFCHDCYNLEIKLRQAGAESQEARDSMLNPITPLLMRCDRLDYAFKAVQIASSELSAHQKDCLLVRKSA